jgi:tripartite-type tricarboxylate transporter receptor subunit TctC
MGMRSLWSAGLFVLTLAGAASAQNYPQRPIRMIVPQTAGGSMDTNARLLAEPLARELRQNIIIDNRGGANGIIAGEMVMRAAPDGYTFIYTSNSLINNQLVRIKPPFDVLRDFEPVTLIAKNYYIVLVHPAVPAQSLRDLLELSKSGREVIRYGSGGIGNSQHLLGELFNARTGSKFLHVPYKGLPIPALLSNEIQLVFASPLTVMSHIGGGRLRPLAVTSAKRWQALPDLPTTGETMPGFVYEAGWHGVFAPARTPRPVVLRMQGELVKAVRLPKLREFLENGGYETVVGTPEEFRRFLEADLKNVAANMRIAGVKPE